VVQFLEHIPKLIIIFGTHNLQTFIRNTLINKLLLIQFYLFNNRPKLHHWKWQQSRVTLPVNRRNVDVLFSICSLRDDNVVTSKPTWKLQHANSILEYFEYFCQMSWKSILIVLSYTISKLVNFSETQCTITVGIIDEWIASIVIHTLYHKFYTNVQYKTISTQISLHHQQHNFLYLFLILITSGTFTCLITAWHPSQGVDFYYVLVFFNLIFSFSYHTVDSSGYP